MLYNRVYFTRTNSSTYVNIGPNTDAASFEFANNLWYAFNQPNQSRPTLPAAETDGVYELNPQFVDAAAGNFAITTNSPAAGKGRRLPKVWADLLEHCYANPPSIGAFEAKPPPPDRAGCPGPQRRSPWRRARARRDVAASQVSPARQPSAPWPRPA